MIKYFQPINKCAETNKIINQTSLKNELIWSDKSEAWICTCGAVYKRAFESKPTIGWCMKCRKEWI